MERIFLVQKNSYGRIKFIEMILDSDTVHRNWGLIGGKSQSTSNRYGYINKGKSNELSPEESAKEDFNRLIESRIKEGYLVTKSLEELPDFDNDNMNFDSLPVQFCCSKPHTSISKTKLNKLLKEKRAKLFIKENGLCHFILITSKKEVKIYTRRIDDHTRKYPRIVKEVERLDFPPNTLLVGELIIDPELDMPHMAAFKAVSSVSRSDTLKGKVKEDISKTLKLQEETPVKMVIFNILFMDGVDFTKTLDYDKVLNLIDSFVLGKNELLRPREMKFDTYDKAYDWAKENLIVFEGLVAWCIEENAEITYNGKPNRRACYKLKATREDDVVAYGWEEGSGSKQGKIGSLLIGKYNEDDEIVPMGKVGAGLRIKEGDCDIENWQFPCVIEIEYEQRFGDTGRYQFPRFTKKHEDKIPSDIRISEEDFDE